MLGDTQLQYASITPLHVLKTSPPSATDASGRVNVTEVLQARLERVQAAERAYATVLQLDPSQGGRGLLCVCINHKS